MHRIHLIFYSHFLSTYLLPAEVEKWLRLKRKILFVRIKNNIRYRIAKIINLN